MDLILPRRWNRPQAPGRPDSRRHEGAEIGLFITLEEHKKPMLAQLLMPTYQRAERLPNKKAVEQKELFG